MNSTQRSNHWSLTINNPTASDYEEMDRARQKGWKVTGQIEKGEEGTPHLQLHLQTPQVRFSAVKKAFTRAHIEVARNAQALENYVTKDETRVGELPTSQEKYPSLSKFWQLVYLHIDAQNWVHWELDSWYQDAYADFGIPEYPPSERKRDQLTTEIFEACVEHLIAKGYHVEHFFSPPNISVFKKFHFAILQRSYSEIVAQTSRQTDMRSDDDESVVSMEHNHAISEVQEVQVPTVQEALCPTSPSDASP